jgi:hypothetical protein
MTGLVSSLFLPGRVHAQAGAPGQSEAELRENFQPLDLKPGCWQLRTNLSQTGVLDHTSPETYRASMPNATPAELAKIVADVNAQVDKQEAASKKGTNSIKTACPLKRDFETEIISPILHNLGGGGCSNTLHSSGQELHLHRQCPAGDSGQVDFERIDAENFKGTVHLILSNGKKTTTIATYVGKWISDGGPHLPSAVATDANGAKPKGPGAVAQLDPLRIVATIAGKQLTARQGSDLLKGHNDNGSGLPELLEKLYMQSAIAEEAVKLHLDRQSPWKEKLQNTQMQIFQRYQTYLGDPRIPPQPMAEWREARGHILWNAYFSRAATDEEKQTLMNQEKDKYKIQVRDPDFFSVQ